MNESKDPREILDALIAQKIRAGFNMGERAIDEINRLFGFDRPILKDRSDGISKAIAAEKRCQMLGANQYAEQQRTIQDLKKLGIPERLQELPNQMGEAMPRFSHRHSLGGAIANIDLSQKSAPPCLEETTPSRMIGRSTEVPIDSMFNPPSDDEVSAIIEDMISRHPPSCFEDEHLRGETAMYQSNWLYLELEPPTYWNSSPRPSGRYIWGSSPTFETMSVAELGCGIAEEIVFSERRGTDLTNEINPSVWASFVSDINAPDVHERCAGCDFYSGAKELRCAVNPDGNPDECMHFEGKCD